MITLTVDQLMSSQFRIKESECFETVFEREIVSWNDDFTPIFDYESYCQGNITLESGNIQILFYWIAKGGSESYQKAYEFDLGINLDMEVTLFGARLIYDNGEEVDYIDTTNFLIEYIKQGVDWKKEARKHLPTPKFRVIRGARAA